MNIGTRKLLTAFILYIFSQTLVAMESDELQEISKELIEFTCKNNTYRECLGLSEEVCSKYIKAALEACPLKHYESLEQEAIDSPCITNKFFDIVDIPDHVAISCDKILTPELELMREKINKLMPNNAVK